MQDVVVPVSAFVHDLKNAVEGAFGFVALRGEITNLTRAYSGHIYFTLKDNDAQIKCALFKNQQKMNKAELKNDAEYVVYGRISVYEPRTEITLVASLVVPFGEGLAAMQLKMLKEKLYKEGVFDQSHKKPLPEYPAVVGVVTAESGAAIHDIIKVSRKRFPAAQIVLSPALVQGRDAHLSIIAALEKLSALDEVEVIIIGRGGGSKEDLEPFNSEELARAVIACEKPIVSAVGHETDTTILDLAASFSVATPSAAAELIFPDSTEILQNTKHTVDLMRKETEGILFSKFMQLDNLTLSLKNPKEIINSILHDTERLMFKAEKILKELINQKSAELSDLEKRLETVNPLSPLQRGFAIVSQNGKTVKKSVELEPASPFEIRFGDGKVRIKE
ncbi:exodeoxyribonuclease VII large subunit [bacterium]|nr:exodeoxyribonuclease VII large subunit [bacterium]